MSVVSKLSWESESRKGNESESEIENCSCVMSRSGSLIARKIGLGPFFLEERNGNLAPGVFRWSNYGENGKYY